MSPNSLKAKPYRVAKQKDAPTLKAQKIRPVKADPDPILRPPEIELANFEARQKRLLVALCHY